jgi:hypothetical protein
MDLSRLGTVLLVAGLSMLLMDGCHPRHRVNHKPKAVAMAAPAKAEPEDAYIAKGKAYVESAFGNDPKKAFDRYAGPDGKISRGGVEKFLRDADIGGFFLRGVIADEVMAQLDKDGDGKLSWDELQAGQSLLPMKAKR